MRSISIATLCWICLTNLAFGQNSNQLRRLQPAQPLTGQNLYNEMEVRPEVEYDEFTGYTTISTPVVQLVGESNQPLMDLTAFAICSDSETKCEPGLIRLMFSSSSSSWKYIDYYDFAIAFPREPWQCADQFEEWDGSVLDSGSVLEFVTCDITVSDAENIASLTRSEDVVKGRLGVSEFILSTSYFPEALNRMLRKIENM